MEVESRKSYKYVHSIFPRGRKLDSLSWLPMVWSLIWAFEVDGMYGIQSKEAWHEFSHGPFNRDLWMSHERVPCPKAIIFVKIKIHRLIHSPHLLVQATGERRVLALVATSGCHWLK